MSEIKHSQRWQWSKPAKFGESRIQNERATHNETLPDFLMALDVELIILYCVGAYLRSLTIFASSTRESTSISNLCLILSSKNEEVLLWYNCSNFSIPSCNLNFLPRRFGLDSWPILLISWAKNLNRLFNLSSRKKVSIVFFEYW